MARAPRGPRPPRAPKAAPVGLEVDVLIEDPEWGQAIKRAEDFCAVTLIAAAKAQARVGAVSVLLTSDSLMRTLNRGFRGQDKPTNVLSFPPAAGPGPFGLLGDIALARETVFSEAQAQGKSPEAHVAHLLVHGFLHLIGYDHEAEEAATAMEAREREILAGLGYGDPYAGER